MTSRLGTGKPPAFFYRVTLTANLYNSVYFPVLPGISPPPPFPTPAGDEFARKMTLLLQGSGDDTGGRKEGGGRKVGEDGGWKYRRSKVPRSSIVRHYHPIPFIYALDCQAL